MRSDDESKAINKVLASKAAQESRGECELCRATGKELRPYGPHGQRVCNSSPWSYPDDHTIKYEPFAGVTLVLSCKQRFAVRMGGSVAYRDIAFVDATLPKPEAE